MKEWFESLEPRERLTLMIGAIALVLALLWTQLVYPLYSSASQRQEQITQLRADLLRATELNAEIAALGQISGAGTVAGRDLPLMIVLERSAGDAGLQLDQSRPTDETTVRVRLESASFDSLISWMAILSSRYGVDVSVASIDRKDGAPGTVDAQITLTRPAA